VDFAITTELVARCTVVAVHGELDLASAPGLECGLARLDPGSPLVVDLSPAAFLDSFGIRAALGARLPADQAPCAVVCPEPRLRRLLLLGGADPERIYDTLDAALAVVSDPACHDSRRRSWPGRRRRPIGA
jgi:anti-anti-sigma factor